MCSFDKCSEKVVARGLCRGHYSQYYSGKPLTPIKKPVSLPVVNGKKKCRECKKEKPVSDFYLMNKRGKLSSDCKPCYSKKVVDRRNK